MGSKSTDHLPVELLPCKVAHCQVQSDPTDHTTIEALVLLPDTGRKGVLESPTGCFEGLAAVGV